MSADKLDISIEPMVEAALRGGAILRAYFGRSIEVTQKSTAADLQTIADLESEGAILEHLTTYFPGLNIMSEETGMVDNGSDYTFVIDPMDGTHNFTLCIPNFSVSIGLMHGDSAIAGVVLNPISGQLFHGLKDGGAFLDGAQIHVSSETDIVRSTISHVGSYTHDPEVELQVTRELKSRKKVKRFLKTWSVALDLCLVAAGRIEGVINDNTELYDFVAGRLIAKEAGAIVSDFSNKPLKNDRDRRFIVSNGPAIHRELIDAMSHSNET